MSKKVPIIIIIVLVIFSLIVFLLFHNKEDDINKNINGYLVIDNYSTWHYSKEKWNSVSKNNINDNALEVYINNKYYGEYTLKYGNIWNLFDANNNYVNYDGSLIAASKSLNLSVYNFEVSEVNSNDLSTIRKIINYNVDIDNLTTNEKVVVDLDNNGTYDGIISVSNLDSFDEEKYFNLVYVVLNNEVKVLINKEVTAQNIYNEPIYNIKNIININNDLNKSFILQRGYFSEAGETGYILYSISDKNYQILMED